MPTKLSTDLIKKLAAPRSGNRILYDTIQRGFGIRVTANESKAFILGYSAGGRERRYTIGSYPEWTLAAARERAKELRRQIDQGSDPLQKKQEERTAPTVSDLWEVYRTEHLPRLSQRTHQDIGAMWSRYILPELGGTKVAQLSATDIDKLHRKISVRTPTRANRVIAVLRKALNLVKRREWIDRNPAVGVQRNPEEARHRYLNADEMRALSSAISTLENTSAAAALRLLILTGARLREVLGAEWSQFDLEARRWTKPAATTKQRRLHVVPLSEAAVELLRGVPRESTAQYAFPNRNGGPIADLKRPWRQVVRLAGLNDVRIHDLRHTFASQLISSGETLSLIGSLLGHTQAQTTLRYAHLADDPQRAAVNRLAASIAQAAAE